MHELANSIIHEQEEGVNISANAVHPGVIATNLFRGRTIVAGTFLKSEDRFHCLKTKMLPVHPNISDSFRLLSMIL
jgi:NAD(P)-dependent dehydrogenase (short-subunit alcohol dehydrogenase family)